MMIQSKIMVGCGVLLAAVLFTPATATAGEKAKDKPVTPKTEQYDANKDGVLDEQECATMKAEKAAKRHANLLKKYDANKNGQLEPEEEAKHQADLAKRREQRLAKKMAKEQAAAASDTPAAPEAEEAEDEPVEEVKTR